ncbi:MAG: uracil-DNA glycosylase [Ruminococcaceae bacterium]|jgi:uracil-DNA glycosylase|nr:uracil-DNA glycosylase [Oscillospiraceae bacterium]
MVHIGNDWDKILAEDFASDYYANIRAFLKREYAQHTIYPSMYDIFNALKTTAYKDVNVVILGQDPYHGPGQAHGYAFSVRPGVQIPPSLVNIYKELHDELGIEIPQTGCLLGWAQQGVLLLNTALTVREASPNSHRDCGWTLLTDSIIRKLNLRDRPMVFMLWGANARAKTALITNPAHLVLTAPHPSPLSASRGFFGCGHFRKANEFLAKQDKPVRIDWAAL